jgi:hypothetical protein
VTTKSRACLVMVAIGWPAYQWEEAGHHHFSSGSKYFAIALTVVWFLGAAVALSGKRLPWWPKRED